MKINRQNLRILLLIMESWFVSMIRILFLKPAAYIARMQSSGNPLNEISENELVPVRKIVKGVRQLSPVIAGKRKCLVEAFIVHRTLIKLDIPAEIRLGTRKGEDGLSAHAWVTVGGRTVIGGPVKGYEELIRTH